MAPTPHGLLPLHLSHFPKASAQFPLLGGIGGISMTRHTGILHTTYQARPFLNNTTHSLNLLPDGEQQPGAQAGESCGKLSGHGDKNGGKHIRINNARR